MPHRMIRTLLQSRCHVVAMDLAERLMYGQWSAPPRHVQSLSETSLGERTCSAVRHWAALV